MESYVESTKELINQITQRAMKGEGECFAIKKQGAKAIVNASGLSDIRNAIVIVETKNSFREWEVREYEVTKCPVPIHIGIKNIKVVAGCIGDKDKEDSYFELKKTQNAQPKISSICAVIEVEEGTIAFCYNSEANESYYIAQASYGKERTDLFVIAQYLRNFGGISDEEKDIRRNGLEMYETATMSTVFENAYQW